MPLPKKDMVNSEGRDGVLMDASRRMRAKSKQSRRKTQDFTRK